MATRQAASAGKATKRAAKKGARARAQAEEPKRGRAGARGRAASAKRGAGSRAAAARRGGAGAGKAAGKRGRPAGGRGRQVRLNAIALLKDDHDRVQDMFERFERARSEEQKQQLAERICDELTLHAQVEEEIFYPAIREALGEDDLVDEAEVEHASAKLLIAQIQRGKMGDPQWEAKVKVLGEYVRHHIREEQREIFARARSAKKLDLRALGERIAERKEGGTLPEVRATAAAMVGGDMGTADKGSSKREPGILERAVNTLLPGGDDR